MSEKNEEMTQYVVTQARNSDTGNPAYEAWEDANGKLDRPDGPAYREWRFDGKLIVEAWHRNDEYHRTDGPAVIRYSEDPSQSYKIEEWWQRGRRHRDDGPAYVRYNYASGSVDVAEWWRNGQRIERKAMAPRTPGIP